MRILITTGHLADVIFCKNITVRPDPNATGGMSGFLIKGPQSVRSEPASRFFAVEMYTAIDMAWS
jgi:hypothetical protein